MSKEHDIIQAVFLKHGIRLVGSEDRQDLMLNTVRCFHPHIMDVYNGDFVTVMTELTSILPVVYNGTINAVCIKGQS
jgi:hypothetical protein